MLLLVKHGYTILNQLEIFEAKFGYLIAVEARRKLLICIFFSCIGIALQIPVPKDKCVTGQYWRDIMIKKPSRNIVICQYFGMSVY